MPQPTVTVLMSVYNGMAYVQAAMRSILGQTFRDFEFLIIDDGSTDGSWELMQRVADHRLRFLRYPTNRGRVAALNHGIAVAQGQFIARMDADDLAEPMRIAIQLTAFARDPELALLGSWAIIIDEQGNTIDRIRLKTSDEVIKTHLLAGNQFIHGAVMFRKKTAVAVGSYRDGYPDAEDYDLWLRLSNQHRVANIPAYLQRWRRHPRSVSQTNRAAQIAATVAVRRDYIEGTLRGRPDEPQRLRRALKTHPHDELLATYVADPRWRTGELVSPGRWAWWKWRATVRTQSTNILKRILPAGVIDQLRRA